MKQIIKSTSLIALSTLGLCATLPAIASEGASKGEVNLYSARKEALIKPLLDEFTKETGVKVNLQTGKADALLKRIQTEGKNTKADLFVTVDAGRLQRAKDAGVLQTINSDKLNGRIPYSLRDKNGQWYGLSKRSRVIVYNKDKVKPSELSTYEDLASPKWKGRICIRSSSNIYNQSLLASMIAHHGKAYALDWAKGVVANMARAPQGNDRAQMKAASAGVCDLAIVNTYYYGNILNSKNLGERKYSKNLAIFFPNQNDRGAHINVSGAGVTKYAKNKDNAVKLLEFLTGTEAQEFYADVNNEFPVVNGTRLGATVKSWGKFKEDNLPINKLGKYNADAVKIFDKAGWK